MTGVRDRPRVGVSSCLLGEEVRFNGGHKRYRFLTDSLDPYVDWVPYCPEMEIGLGTPREAIRLTAAGRLVNRSGTADHTAAMAALPLPADLDGYVFKAKSPSCGIRAVPRYRDDGHRGVTAPAFTPNGCWAVPLLATEDEGRLNDPGRREAFTERIFAAARLRALWSGQVDRGTWCLPRPAQAAVAGPRPGALPVGGPGGGRGPPGAYRRGVPGLFWPRWRPRPAAAARQRAAARVWPDRPGARPAAAGRPGGQDEAPAPSGAAERPMRCSPTTPAAAGSPGWRSRPTCSRSRLSSGCGTSSETCPQRPDVIGCCPAG